MVFPVAMYRCENWTMKKDACQRTNVFKLWWIHSFACVLSHFSHVQFFATQWTVICQVPLSTGFFRQEQWSGWPFPPPGDLPNPDIKPASLMFPALAGRFFTTSASWKVGIHSWEKTKVEYYNAARIFVLSSLNNTSGSIENTSILLKLVWNSKEENFNMGNYSLFYLQSGELEQFWNFF